jgi:hypothetical protein
MATGGQTPGPGRYSTVDALRPKTAGGTFGYKFKSSLEVNPTTAKHVGPGSYNSKNDFKAGSRKQDTGFGTAGLDMQTKSAMALKRVPGPGAYTLEFEAGDKGVSIGKEKRKLVSDEDKTPGPG